MAGGGSSPTDPPPAKCRNEPSNTTIHSLGEDLLLAIFLRLPSLATLVRAALTCRLWHRPVASSPAFRRRFRALHPPPFLGLFFQDAGAELSPNTHAFPAFVPARRCDRDLTAAVRGGDFFLTSLQDLFDECFCWYFIDCVRGCVLLMNGDDLSFVVFNPLMRQCEDAFDPCSEEDTIDGHHGKCRRLDPRLVLSGEDPSSFRVVLLAHDESRVRATVFSSDTWEWSVHPWVDVPSSSDPDYLWLQGGMQSNGFLYWAYDDQKYLVSLDTSTMEFSVSELPDCLRLCYFAVGEMNDEATCIVYSDEFNVGVLMHASDDDGIERWMLDRIVPLDTELHRVLEDELTGASELNVFAVRDGYAYLAVIYDDPQTPSWYLSLCLETMKLERLFRRTFDPDRRDVHPCIMAWPPSLLDN
ncbi:hypothetical protein EJB05_57390, partial [Eragrostis curvula]